ncbi:archaeal proteasome endopeptidase complex subunit alpha [Candidatus Woesearchaeota archaeon]|nr:archaeal proteasome endopeptidase complex subunit alpha [Candidatus Woesearchaeota archaeon]
MQQQQPVDKMGYDRSITMFSPDGRLLQVEYAKKTVKQGSTAIGMVCKDGVILVADKRITDKLMVPEAVEKMFKIDDHVGATAAGIIPDARVLIDRVQLKAQQHSITYDSKIDIISIVKDICDLKQICTQSAGLRPFGVSLLIAGVEEDGTPKLFLTEPYGLYFQYQAVVIGEGEGEVHPILQKKYKPNLTMETGLQLAVDALREALEKEFNLERIDAAFIPLNSKKYKKLSREEIKNILKQ